VRGWESTQALTPHPTRTSLSRNASHSLPQGAREEKIRVARIGAAHGVRGEVKLWSFTQEPMAIADYGPLETEDGAQRFEIETLRRAKDFLVARIAGVVDRDAAAKLCNVDLFVPRDRLPPIEEDDTYYHADLVGMAAITPQGVPIGNVTAIHNFGAGDLIEIASSAGGEPMLLPFTESVVTEIDTALRQITIVLPNVVE
jgi:16S rRNA processing protein RimM